MTSTRHLIEQILAERILVLDGAMGTMIHAQQPTEDDYRGRQFANHSKLLKNCTEVLTLTQPEMIEEIHTAYLEAGADIIETNTFNSNALSMADYGLQDHVVELNQAAAQIARRAADAMTRRTPDRPRFVAGCIGPTNKTLNISGDVNDPGYRATTWDEMVAAYSEQVHGLVTGGVDLLLAETAFDTLEYEGMPVRDRRVFPVEGDQAPGDGLDDDLQRRQDAHGAVGRGLLGVGLAVRHAQRRDQLRARPRADAALHRAALRDRAGPAQLLPERRPAERDGRVRRDARADGHRARRVGAERLAQHRRRLLRDDPAPHRRDRAGRPKAQAARSGRPRPATRPTAGPRS